MNSCFHAYLLGSDASQPLPALTHIILQWFGLGRNLKICSTFAETWKWKSKCVQGVCLVLLSGIC